MIDQITIRGARLHNLKNITLTIPKNQLVVLSGVSGSGKSTLGFDILHKESQRQFMEACGWTPFGLARPPVDAISGLSPTISIDQRLTNNNPRSTLGTSTDIYTYLRVLFARLGHRPCPACGKDIPPTIAPGIFDWAGDDELDDHAGDLEKFFPCPHCEAPVAEMSMANFSFNKPAGACPTCTGLGSIHQVDIHRLVDDQKSILEKAVAGWVSIQINYYVDTMLAAADYYGFTFDPTLPVKDFTETQRDLLFYGVNSPQFRRHYPGITPPATVRQGRFEGIATNLLRRYAERIEDPDYRAKQEALMIIQVCPDCEGTRLRPESRSVSVHGESIIALSRLLLDQLRIWLDELPTSLSVDEKLLAGPILGEIDARIARLIQVGAGYLTLERASPSLSAGESQRLRLAALLGSELSGVLYIFDEPTIGTHQRDTRRLIEVLRRLRDLGNTILVIEHDLEMIAAADTVIDFGPGAGRHGGQVVASGAPSEIANHAGSVTGDYLSRQISIPVPKERRAPTERAIRIHGARHHNLKGITIQLPLGLLVAVTGVSGSGKTSLIFDILDRAIRQRLYGASKAPGAHDGIAGIEHLDKIITIGQEPIGRIPRSNVATFSDVFTPIRTAYAATSEALRRGLTTRYFSFNIPGGRCERCEGAGVLTVNMHFLPEIEVPCPACHGRRFKQETLEVRYQDYDIAQSLELTIEEALAVFNNLPAARSRLQALCDVGLGYLQLGQLTNTLSAGEAQRIKLAKELGRRSRNHTLYLLDEPTTGLHLADTARLLGVLQRLVDGGSSVIVIEHNLELVKTADWIIDLGPEGGAAGGKLVAEGTPEQVAQVPGSYTGQILQMLLGDEKSSDIGDGERTQKL
jgi:excinuclease ABC subunit A